MSNLLAAMVAASKRVADPIAAGYAEGNRAFQVIITRPGGEPTYDRDTKEFVNPEDPVIYEGPGRLTTGSGPVEVQVGDESLSFTSARLSINSGGTIPRKDDLVFIVDDEQSQATHVAERWFAVQDVEVAGHFGVGYVMSVLGVSPSRRT